MKEVILFDCVNNIRKNKEELLRIVLTPEGEIKVDTSGKMNGRGAYLTPNLETVKLAKKNHRLEKALKTKIEDEVYEDIYQFIRSRSEVE